MQKDSIGFIGAGNMATAIIKGMTGKGNYPPQQIYVYDLDREKCLKLAAGGICVADSAQDIIHNCKIIFLAVKPQNYESVLSSIKEAVTPDKIFVTIAAGISTAYINRMLGKNCPIARAMPNTPLLLGKGATALCKGEGLSEEDFQVIHGIFAASGEVAVLTEDKMNTVIAVNGSSPAYIYLFAKAITDYAVAQGIDYQVALSLICKTLEGSAEMLRSSGNTPDELIKMVSSPGGTTLKALEALDEKGFYGAILDAMDRCTKRAEELGK